MTTATRARRRQREPITEEQRAAWKTAKAARRAALDAVQQQAATVLLADHASATAFLDACASIGAGDHDGATYTLRNALLLWGQNPRITHVGSLAYWRKHGRKVRKGSKALGIFVRIGKTNEADKDDEETTPAEQEDAASRRRRPLYKVQNGTYDVSDTIPIETCPHCGTPAPAEPDAEGCPPTCQVFALRTGSRPSVSDVLALAASLLEEDEPDE